MKYNDLWTTAARFIPHHKLHVIRFDAAYSSLKRSCLGVERREREESVEIMTRTYNGST